MRSNLNELIESVQQRSADKIANEPAVVVKDDSFDASKLPVDAAEWHSLEDVACVYFDMKSSTRLAIGRDPAETASIYDAGVGGVVKVLRDYEADFVDIQGDGGFGLFWGDHRYERALVASITIRTFSSVFTEQVSSRWPNAPSTGFKVGVASSYILAKRVGLPRQLDFQEPVWAGNAVNYAAKAAQQTDPGITVVTASVWDAISQNDFLTFSCDCTNSPSFLWETKNVENIPDLERFGMSISRSWCATHGEEFADAILSGDSRRLNVSHDELSRRTRATNSSEPAMAAARRREAERDSLRKFFSKR